MVELGISVEDIEKELKSRRSKIGNLKAERKSINEI